MRSDPRRSRLRLASLEAGPAEVRRTRSIRVTLISSTVVPADVADPELVAPGPQGEAERVAQAVGDDARPRCPGAAASGFSGDGAPESGSIRAIVPSRVIGSPGGDQVLGAERAALRDGSPQALNASPRSPMSSAVVSGAVAAADEQRAAAVEDEVADRVARELLAPVLEQDRLGRLPARPQGQPRDAAAHRAADLEGRIGLALEAPVPVACPPGPRSARRRRAARRRCSRRRRRAVSGRPGRRRPRAGPRSLKE